MPSPCSLKAPETHECNASRTQEAFFVERRERHFRSMGLIIHTTYTRASVWYTTRARTREHISIGSPNTINFGIKSNVLRDAACALDVVISHEQTLQEFEAAKITKWPVRAENFLAWCCVTAYWLYLFFLRKHALFELVLDIY